MGVCDFYVRDKATGKVHRVGDDRYDSIWVDLKGELHYFNMLSGDGCSGQTLGEDAYLCGYEFLPSMDGDISENGDIPGL